jgi:PadR family transcriptional regulator, regulatory protein PadR
VPPALTHLVDYSHNVTLIMLGEFEYLVIVAAVRLGDDAYGAAIRQEIEDAAKRRCSTGSLYTTLDRLETKGLIKTWMGDATPQRGGRAKRMIRVTPKGVRAAAAFYEAVMRVSRGVSWSTQLTEVRGGRS